MKNSCLRIGFRRGLIIRHIHWIFGSIHADFLLSPTSFLSDGSFGGMPFKEERLVLPDPKAENAPKDPKKRKRDRPSLEDQLLPDIKKRRLGSNKPQDSDTVRFLGIAPEGCASRVATSGRSLNFPDDGANHGTPTKRHRNVRFQIPSTSSKPSPRRIALRTQPGFTKGREDISWPNSRPSSVSLEKAFVEGHTCPSVLVPTPGWAPRIIQGQKGNTTDSLAPTSTTNGSALVSLPMLLSTLQTSGSCDDIVPRNDLKLATDSEPLSHWDSEEAHQESGQTDWAELSSEEEVELQLELDSDAETPVPSGEVADAEDGEGSHDWTFQLHEGRTTPEPELRETSSLQHHELVQRLFTTTGKEHRIPIGYLLKADVGHSQAILVQSGMAYRGEKIVFSRLI